jgi:hypothetical protein
MLLLLFFVAYVYNDWTKKRTNNQAKTTLIQTNELKKQIRKLKKNIKTAKSDDSDSD